MASSLSCALAGLLYYKKPVGSDEFGGTVNERNERRHGTFQNMRSSGRANAQPFVRPRTHFFETDATARRPLFCRIKSRNHSVAEIK